MASEQPVLEGWQVWQSRDGDTDSWWYATRMTGPALPANPPKGWAATVHGRTEADLRAAVARQDALERVHARRLRAAR